MRAIGAFAVFGVAVGVVSAVAGPVGGAAAANSPLDRAPIQVSAV